MPRLLEVGLQMVLGPHRPQLLTHLSSTYFLPWLSPLLGPGTLDQYLNKQSRNGNQVIRESLLINFLLMVMQLTHKMTACQTPLAAHPFANLPRLFPPRPLRLAAK